MEAEEGTKNCVPQAFLVLYILYKQWDASIYIFSIKNCTDILVFLAKFRYLTNDFHADDFTSSENNLKYFSIQAAFIDSGQIWNERFPICMEFV